ncbi:hypothetical protein IFM89_018855 [Coptis chinensis]|uniref:cyclin-dependent kinase n=1 Tax=Coptis chinensis TaxID=261450 RepID=A0A835HTT7_9MAGN|nr:hypothetical protein IFM89_018855 [Coptis chinensis]
MAAGRHGGYRDNEWRDNKNNHHRSNNESDNNELRKRKDFYKSIRDNNDKDWDGRRDRFRIRQKDVKEREEVVITTNNSTSVNGGGSRSSSSSGSGSGSGSGSSSGGGSDRRRSRLVVCSTVEREPGELSSGSDGDVGSEPSKVVKDKMENGVVKSPPSKKRKFSPIVWDRDEKDVGSGLKLRVSPLSSQLPPPPPRSKSFQQLPQHVVSNGDVQISSVNSGKHYSSKQSPDKVVGMSGSVQSSLSASPIRLSSSSPLEQPWNNSEEPRLVEDEEFVPARNISASRWAAESHSPRDEGEISDDGGIRRRKKTPASGSLNFKKSTTKVLSPELEELRRDTLEVTRKRSSESGGSSNGSGSEGEYLGPELEKSNDYMETDDEGSDDNVNNHKSGTDSGDDKDIRRTPEQMVPPQRSINMLHGCRSVDEFERLNKIDEGTYGVVYRAKDKKTGEIVALKKVKMEKEREGFPLTSLREINILLSFHHPSIVDVKEVVVGSSLDSIFMVMEYMEHDLKALMETMKQPYSQSEVKCLMVQLLEGVKYLHDNWVLHRDLKTSNLLLNNKGELKICDFGLSRQYGSPLKPYTHLVVTLWYRAPELLLGAKQYSTAIDMWSLGCIMAELLAKEPLFNGKSEVDQLDKIFRKLGTPSEAIWPGFSKLPGVKVNFVKQPLPALGDSGQAFWYNLLRKKFPPTSFTGSPVLSDAGFDLLNKLLTYDPAKRITAEDALNHEWFQEVPLPKSKDFMPTFPAQHAQDRRLRRVMKSPDPLEEQRRKELQQRELGPRGNPEGFGVEVNLAFPTYQIVLQDSSVYH